ncbi:aldo/keto reductase [Hymenobacter arizonensis]|uniref:Predicted oxidoreductase n=1 Tax=Hymenobacter arizonensis TaxID=1227077 RepID=A0A1I5T425_HYMAR|nr:aldo/keto reductase [Hymenobacter arizonensis]SFP77780.1 Predicted oxidoreductase [Hymenobacter arizonensis]
MPSDFARPSAADFIGRLALGTAQFGLAYGINNTAGRPDEVTVAAILQHAHAAGINLLDTAAAYGDSESRLGSWLGAPGREPAAFQVVTKLMAGPAVQVRQQLQESQERFGQTHLYGVLFHQFAAFRQHPDAWLALQEARAAGTVQRIGLSLYHPEEAEWLLAELPDVDLVQVPFNVLDQRFRPLLPELQRRGVEVHVRSAFLQGLLLREPATLPPFFATLTDKITRLHAMAAEAGVPTASLLLLFAAFAPGVSRVVIGVDTPANLRDNLAAASHVGQAEALRSELLLLAEKTTDYILPYTWPPRS